MKTTIIALLSIALFTTLGRAEDSVILKQKTAPLTITGYKAELELEFKGKFSRDPEQIRHVATYKNTSGKEIVALQIGFAAFDAFNALMGGFSGWSIKTVAADGSAEGDWAQQTYATFSFAEYGTGVAYVKAVRFADGTIWRANMAEVLIEMQKFEKDLKKEDLEEKKK